MEWVSVKEKLPEHEQHVLVWEDRFNVFLWKKDHPLSDDGTGRVRMGDAKFIDLFVDWESSDSSYRGRWGNDFGQYIELNGPRYRWKGQGPCSFSEVTHWMPLPEPPDDHKRLDYEHRR